jgi:DNA-directed RNA polymerase specialized sigma24 family protein
MRELQTSQVEPLRVVPASRNDEPALLRAAAQGDLPAYHRLSQGYQDEIFNLVSYLAPDELSAQDTFDEVFSTAFRELPRRQDLAFRDWLLRCTVRVCRAHRWRWAGKAARDGLRRLDQARRCLAGLPLELGLSVALVDLAGLDYSQAAAILGVPEKMLSRRLAQARQCVAQRLSGLEQEYGL